MKVDGTNLSMIRGDSESITVAINDEMGDNIILKSIEDTIYLTIKLNTTVEEKVLQKVINTFNPDGAARIEFTHDETKNLPYRSYKYDIQWVDKNGKVRTLVAPSLFTIEPEITFE